MLFQKVKCLARTYKSGSLSCKLSKNDNIYKRVYFIIKSTT